MGAFPSLSLSLSLFLHSFYFLFFFCSTRNEIERRYSWYGLTTTNTPCLGPPLHPVSCVSLNEARSTEPSFLLYPLQRSSRGRSQIRGAAALCSVSSPATSHALMDSYSGPAVMNTQSTVGCLFIGIRCAFGDLRFIAGDTSR